MFIYVKLPNNCKEKGVRIDKKNCYNYYLILGGIPQEKRDKAFFAFKQG